MMRKSITPWQAMLLAGAVPALICLLLILRYGVNLPVLDEIALINTMNAFDTGSLTFARLWELHNEHRIFLPRLIAVPVLAATNYDSRALMTISWLSVVVVMICLLASARRFVAGSPWVWPSIFLASALLFSPIHKPTFFDGFQFTMGLPNAFVVVALLLLSPPAGPSYRQVGIAALSLVLASVSSMNGPAGFPLAIVLVLVLLRGRKLAVALLILGVALAIGVGANLEGLLQPAPYGVIKGYALKHPREGLDFLVALIGAPLAYGWPISVAEAAGYIGWIGLLGGIAFTVSTIRSRDTRQYGLLAITLFGFMGAAAATIGRSSWGAATAATQSRWMCFTVLIWCGLLIWVASVWSRFPGLANLARAADGFVAAIVLFGFVAGLAIVAPISRSRETLRQSLGLVSVFDESVDPLAVGPLFPVFPLELPGQKNHGPVLRWSLAVFERYRKDKHPPVQFLETPPDYSGAVHSMGGPRILGNQETLEVSGWAILPKTRKPAPVVAVTVNGTRKVFHLTPGGIYPTPWVKPFFPDGDYANAGFKLQVPARYLPKGKVQLDLWAYDPATNRLSRLDMHYLEEITVN